jgi:hypothetical protein
MQAVEAEVDAMLRRSGSQEQQANLLHCDQAQVSRKATRVAAGDTTWMESLRAEQLIALGSADDRVRMAVEAAMEARPQPMGDAQALPRDIAVEVARAAELTQAWLAAIADNQLTSTELLDVIAKAEALRATCDTIARNARAAARGRR